MDFVRSYSIEVNLWRFIFIELTSYKIHTLEQKTGRQKDHYKPRTSLMVQAVHKAVYLSYILLIGPLI